MAVGSGIIDGGVEVDFRDFCLNCCYGIYGVGFVGREQDVVGG